MIDLNTIISNALTAAVTTAVAPLTERITALESVCATQHEAMVAMRDRITALENNPAQGVGPAITIDEAKMVEALNSQEWFWEKLQNRIDSTVEAGIDDHCSTYDHDDYDRAVSAFDDMPALDDFVTRDSVREEIEDVLNNATLSLSV